MNSKMPISKQDKAEYWLKLYSQKQDYVKQTREIEFKVNLATWTLIVAIGASLNQRVSPESFGPFVCLAILIFGAHLCWMILIQISESRDTYYMDTYRLKIEGILGEPVSDFEKSKLHIVIRSWAEKLNMWKCITIANGLIQRLVT